LAEERGICHSRGQTGRVWIDPQGGSGLALVDACRAEDPAMRSTGTYSTWLTGSSLAGPAAAFIRLTYLGDQVRRAGGVRPGAVLAQRYELEAPLAASTPGLLWQARRYHPERHGPERHGAELHRDEPRPEGRRDEPVTLQLLDPALVE